MGIFLVLMWENFPHFILKIIQNIFLIQNLVSFLLVSFSTGYYCGEGEICLIRDMYAFWAGGETYPTVEFALKLIMISTQYLPYQGEFCCLTVTSVRSRTKPNSKQSRQMLALQRAVLWSWEMMGINLVSCDIQNDVSPLHFRCMCD